MAQALSADTAAQQSIANELGTTAATETQTLNTILHEVEAMQASLVGETGTATQAKAAHLHEAGLALAQQLESIGERVGQSAGGYIATDADGHSMVSASGAAAF